MDWIPVDQALPIVVPTRYPEFAKGEDDSDLVLIRERRPRRHRARTRLGRFCRAQGRFFTEMGWKIEGAVTHWMPLPEGPTDP